MTSTGRYEIKVVMILSHGVEQWVAHIIRSGSTVHSLVRWSKAGAMADGYNYALRLERGHNHYTGPYHSNQILIFEE